MRVPLKPEPNSNPLVAGRDNIAWASLASRRSNTGSPNAGGTFKQDNAAEKVSCALLFHRGRGQW